MFIQFKLKMNITFTLQDLERDCLPMFTVRSVGKESTFVSLKFSNTSDEIFMIKTYFNLFRLVDVHFYFDIL